jgi:CHASE2 domain-containing sensor protein
MARLALLDIVRNLRAAALGLDVLHARPDLVAAWRREARNLAARARRLKDADE